jgi:stringent starvation protein B
MTTMTSNRPYLLRAFFDWIVDNDCTPYLVVNALADGVMVPQHHVSDGQIVLNVAPRAVTAFHMDHESVCFNTRFGGVPTDIYVPMSAIMGIYARENGQGMVFQTEPPDPTPTGGDKPPRGKPMHSVGGNSNPSAKSRRPSLKVVK